MSIDKYFFTSSALKLGVALNDEQADKLSAFYSLVIEKNKLFNLTAITDERDFIIKHFLDSLTAAPYIGSGALCDVGSGAGFPAVPLSIVSEYTNITAIDSTQKKTAFINKASSTLNIPNLTAISGRAEDMKPLFHKFDFVTARAVSSLNVLLEICTPLLSVGGTFIAYKTDDSELSNCGNALKKLNLVFDKEIKLSLPDDIKRCLLLFKKTARTPDDFPRQYSAIKKKPL